MGLFDTLSPGGRRKRFAERVMARLAERGWPHSVRYDPGLFALELGGEVGKVELGAMYDHWSRAPGGSRSAALDEAVAYVFELGPPPPFEEARAQLIPVVRPRAVIEAMLFEPSDDPKAEISEAWTPFGDHLAVHVAIDRPNSLMIINTQTLRDWGCSFDEAMGVALANLRTRSPLAVERRPEGFHVSASNDVNDIARLLLPEQFAALDLNGAPVVVPAARDCLLIAGADDPAGLEAMASYAPTLLDEHPRPISYAPMVLQSGEWRPFKPPQRLPYVNSLYALQQAHDYEQQLPLILGRLKRTGRPQEVAQFVLVPTDEGARSVVLWTAPACLLPRADLIVLRTGQDATLVRAWEDVEAACGGFTWEENTASPYVVAAAWPHAAALERIAAAPEPEWARGKGIGVSGDRLTIFG